MESSDKLDISCPKCGKQVSVPFRKIETHRKTKISCRACGAQIAIDANEFHETIDNVSAEIEKMIAKTNRKFSG